MSTSLSLPTSASTSNTTPTTTPNINANTNTSTTLSPSRAASKSPSSVSSHKSISPSPPLPPTTTSSSSSSSSPSSSASAPVTPKSLHPPLFPIFASSPKLQKLELRIQEDPNDLQAWTQLILECAMNLNANNKDQLDSLRHYFEQILQRFPYSTKHWIMYIDFEIRVKDHQRVSTLFAKCLRQVHSFDLHKVYLNYIKRTHHGEDPQSRTIVKQAYDFVLSKVLHDMESGSIWSDYLTFLKSTQVHSTFEEQQKMEEIRKVYQKAIVLPLQNVEQLWREWDAFENGLNKLTAKKLLSESSSAYLTARSCLRTLRSLWHPIDKSSPFYTYPPTFNVQEQTQLSYWRKLMAYEKTNPLKLDDPSFQVRLTWIFWQAIHQLSKFPEIWFDFSWTLFHRFEKTNEAIQIIKLGCQLCPGSFLLHYSLADLYEYKEDLEKAKQVYEDMLTYWETATDQKKEPPSTVFAKFKETLSVCWILYMRFSARALGIDALRAVFKRARSHPYCTWHVIVASAQYEFLRTQNTTVPKKLFRYAIATFPKDPAPVLAFADWLVGMNDQVNLVSELVKASQSTQLEPSAQFLIMQKLHDYYIDAGSFSFLMQHEKEMETKLAPLIASSFLDHAKKKYTFAGLTPLDRDLGPDALFPSLQGLLQPTSLLMTSSFTSPFTSATTSSSSSFPFLSSSSSSSSSSSLPTSALSGAAAFLTSVTSLNASSGIGTNLGDESMGTTKRRILDEWVAPNSVPAPDTASGRGWLQFKLPKKEEILKPLPSTTTTGSTSTSAASSTPPSAALASSSSSSFLNKKESPKLFAGPSSSFFDTSTSTSASFLPTLPPASSSTSSNTSFRHSLTPPSLTHSSSGSFTSNVSSTPTSSIATTPPSSMALPPYPTEVLMQLLQKLPSVEMFTGPYFDVHGVLNLIDKLVPMASPSPPPLLPSSFSNPSSIPTISTTTTTSTTTPSIPSVLSSSGTTSLLSSSSTSSASLSSSMLDSKDPRRRKRVMEETVSLSLHKKYRPVNNTTTNTNEY